MAQDSGFPKSDAQVHSGPVVKPFEHTKAEVDTKDKDKAEAEAKAKKAKPAEPAQDSYVSTFDMRDPFQGPNGLKFEKGVSTPSADTAWVQAQVAAGYLKKE